MTQGILLVGGLGTRLLPLTQATPKPMLPVAGLPITEHQIVKAKKAGITSLVLATSYLSEVFLPYFGDGSKWGIRLQYAVEKEPLGTGGGIRNAAQLLNDEEPIVVLNGDILSSHDLSRQIRFHNDRDADVTLHLTTVKDARAFGCVPIDDDGRVVAFMEKMESPIATTINAGCYVFNPRVIHKIPLGISVSVEREVFPSLISLGRPVFAVVDDAYWIDLGTPTALLRGSADIVAGRANSEALDLTEIMSRSRDSLVMPGAIVDSTAVLKNGAVIGHGSQVFAGAVVDGSIICRSATVMGGAYVLNSFVADGAIVKAGVHILDCYYGVEGSQKL